MDADAAGLPVCSTASSSNQEDVVQFWCGFRSVCNAFQSRIDGLLLLEGSGHEFPKPTEMTDAIKTKLQHHYATASKRNEGRIELDGILKEVRLLQRFVLSSSSSLTTDSSSGKSSNKVLDKLLSQSMPDLALTDIRLLTIEMERILHMIDEANNIICPKEKFVFRRYRKALEELNLNGSGELINALDCLNVSAGEQKEQDQNKQQKQQLSVLSFGGVVENKSNCNVEIHPDGSVTSTEDAHEFWKMHSAPCVVKHNTSDTGTSSYLIQNVSNSTIVIHPTIQSLHIQNIVNCRIHSVVLGPVHVTNCHNSEIRVSAYQLRVHESKSIKFGAWVRSGPIIEHCTEMTFAGDFYTDDNQPGKNMYWDVKDFNWLRSLRKSPNFTVIEKVVETRDAVLGVDAVISQNGIQTQIIETEENAGEVEDDSEDEL
jgi:hypothetical protein